MSALLLCFISGRTSLFFPLHFNVQKIHTPALSHIYGLYGVHFPREAASREQGIINLMFVLSESQVGTRKRFKDSLKIKLSGAEVGSVFLFFYFLKGSLMGVQTGLWVRTLQIRLWASLLHLLVGSNIICQQKSQECFSWTLLETSRASYHPLTRGMGTGFHNGHRFLQRAGSQDLLW